MALSDNERQILSIFPEGRCRRIYLYMLRNQVEIDNPNRQHGELCFMLYRDGAHTEVSTSGVVWKPERLRDTDPRTPDD